MLIRSHIRNKQRGVSLIEVLIALLVIAVGVLGLSKMQALAIANTQVSGLRSLIALQASSLAATMHSNKGYWQVNPAICQGGCVLSGSVLSGAAATTFGTESTCVSTTTSVNHCSTQQMAAYDLTIWMGEMNTNVPGYTATINCSTSVINPAATCQIKIVWSEKQAGGGLTTASLAATTPAVAQEFDLYVQP
jgi:type IV pilus assembly protein PilV